MTNQEAIKYAKTCIDNIRKYEGNEQFIEAIDIVIRVASTYLEPIDEEKLDKLAKTERMSHYYIDDIDDWIEGFKAGYRKAMEE